MANMHHPYCGEIAARTHIVVSYHGPDGIDYAEFDACCKWDEPPEFVALIDEAEVLEIVTMDGYEQDHFTDYGFYRLANPKPGHYISPDEPWSWTQIGGLLVMYDDSGPDERGLWQVRPKDNG